MFTLKVDTSDLDRLAAQLDEAGKSHVRYAAARALTQVAENARMDTVREMKSRFHAPTDWTLQSMYKMPATKQNLTSMVYLKDGGAGNRTFFNPFATTVHETGISAGGMSRAWSQDKKSILGHLFTAGKRSMKGVERALISRRLMDPGMMIVPGAGAPLDAHGNIPRGFIVQMLSYFKGLRESKDWMADAGRTRFGKRQGKKVGVGGAAVEYFISRGKGNWFGKRSWREGRLQTLPPGIWMRAQVSGGRTVIKPIILFIKKAAVYKQYIDLEAIARTALKRDFDTQFDSAFAEAMRTAR